MGILGFGAGAGDGFSQLEQGRVFLLAEIGRAKELGQAHDLRAVARRLADLGAGQIEIRVGLR